MKDISVTEIVKEIKSEIAEKGYKASDIIFNAIPVNDENTFNENILNQNLTEVNNLWPVDLAPALYGNRITRFIKRAIRKLVRPSFYGSMKKQEKFNCHTALLFSEMNKKINYLEKRISIVEGKK